MAALRHPQLPLGVRLREQATFAGYFPGANEAPVRLLQDEVLAGREGFVYLWGARGTGKTHLLQALCHRAAERGEAAVYLPLREALAVTPDALDDLEQLPLVTVDDLDAAAGQAAWEAALFHLHNRVRERGGCLAMAGARGPAALGIVLADLRSRLAGGLVLQLQTLADDDKAEALRLQARRRGMAMPVEVARYLLRRCPRDMHALFALLDRLDHDSLAAQRRLTVPFVRDVIGAEF
jgi:DnaA family protein